MINVRKRGKVYQYQFEIASVGGKRKYINKLGFKTKSEAYQEGVKAYNNYTNGGSKLEKGIINIKHNVYSKTKDDKGRWFIGKPKTINGERQVCINDTLLKALINYKKKQNYLKRSYGRQYHHYHLEYVENKYGKIVEYRIVETHS